MFTRGPQKHDNWHCTYTVVVLKLKVSVEMYCYEVEKVYNEFERRFAENYSQLSHLCIIFSSKPTIWKKF